MFWLLTLDSFDSSNLPTTSVIRCQGYAVSCRARCYHWRRRWRSTRTSAPTTPRTRPRPYSSQCRHTQTRMQTLKNIAAVSEVNTFLEYCAQSAGWCSSLPWTLRSASKGPEIRWTPPTCLVAPRSTASFMSAFPSSWWRWPVLWYLFYHDYYHNLSQEMNLRSFLVNKNCVRALFFEW